MEAVGQQEMMTMQSINASCMTSTRPSHQRGSGAGFSSLASTLEIQDADENSMGRGETKEVAKRQTEAAKNVVIGACEKGIQLVEKEGKQLEAR